MRTIAGEGVVLEPQLASHATELYAVLRDPSLYKFIDSKAPTSEAGLRERLLRLETRHSPDGTEDWLNWVVRNGAGELVGYVQATVADHSAEIAYVLGRTHWGKGYGFAACTAMITELGERYGARRLTATLDPANTASLALLIRLGFSVVWENVEAAEIGCARDLNP